MSTLSLVPSLLLPKRTSGVLSSIEHVEFSALSLGALSDRSSSRMTVCE